VTWDKTHEISRLITTEIVAFPVFFSQLQDQFKKTIMTQHKFLHTGICVHL